MPVLLQEYGDRSDDLYAWIDPAEYDGLVPKTLRLCYVDTAPLYQAIVPGRERPRS
jgi:hypothetical protein